MRVQVRQGTETSDKFVLLHRLYLSAKLRLPYRRREILVKRWSVGSWLTPYIQLLQGSGVRIVILLRALVRTSLYHAGYLVVTLDYIFAGR